MSDGIKEKIKNIKNETKEFLKDPDGLSIISSFCAFAAAMSLWMAVHHRSNQEKDKNEQPTEQVQTKKQENVKEQNKPATFLFYQRMNSNGNSGL